MSRAESFLRGGTPCTEVPELVDLLSTATSDYTHWRFVAHYPQHWYHDAVENKLSAPLYFLVFACTEGGVSSSHQATSSGTNNGGKCVGAVEDAAWHLLCYTVLPSGAVPHESYSRDGAGGEGVTTGGGGVGALRTLLRTVPASLHPSASLSWVSVMDGIAYERMGLLSEAVFTQSVAPAVAEVLTKHWKAGTGEAGGRTAPATAHLVHNSQCTTTVNIVPSATPPHAFAVEQVIQQQQQETHAKSLHSFVDAVVRPAVRWMSEVVDMHDFITDAAVPALTEEARSLLYPVLADLPPSLYSSRYIDPANVTGSAQQSQQHQPSAPLVDPETLTGLAKLRAERDAGIAQWKRKVGAYTTFTVDMESSAAAVAAARATARPFQYAILLQRPYTVKQRVDVDNRDPGPLSPQPIGAELHLLQDRGDVQYTVGQLGNRSNLHFVYAETVPDDGEVVVQLVPVEGTPFVDLEAYFAAFPADAVLRSSQPCVDSCCDIVVPRVVYQKPTGTAHKANPIATAQAGLEVLAPAAEMVRAAAAALRFLSAHAENVVGGGDPQSSASAPAGYTLHVPPVDFSGVPSRKCGWCGRRREVLLRCGGCRAVWYCCKRHQALDWKEGTHKVECKLWHHARELHESVVEHWVADTAATYTDGTQQVTKDAGWSCAATIVQFLADVEAAEARRSGTASTPPRSCVNSAGVLSLHVAGFDTRFLDGFVRALGSELRRLASGSHQYRLLLCADTFTDAQRNAVWGIRRGGGGTVADTTDGGAWLTSSTGVLGDAWHCKGTEAAAATAPAVCVALVRCCGVKYHNLDRSEPPGAVVSFGPVGGEGCSYLTAALETLAGCDVGVVPVRLVESSYVGAVRTRDALAGRVSSNDSCPAATKARVAQLVAKSKEREAGEVAPTEAAAKSSYTLTGCGSGVGDGGRLSFQILFNDSGAAAVEEADAASSLYGGVNLLEGPTATLAAEPSTEEKEGQGQAVRGGSAVPHYVNSYVFDVNPSDVAR